MGLSPPSFSAAFSLPGNEHWAFSVSRHSPWGPGVGPCSLCCRRPGAPGDAPQLLRPSGSLRRPLWTHASSGAAGSPRLPPPGHVPLQAGVPAAATRWRAGPASTLPGVMDPFRALSEGQQAQWMERDVPLPSTCDSPCEHLRSPLGAGSSANQPVMGGGGEKGQRSHPQGQQEHSLGHLQEAPSRTPTDRRDQAAHCREGRLLTPPSCSLRAPVSFRTSCPGTC